MICDKRGSRMYTSVLSHADAPARLARVICALCAGRKTRQLPHPQRHNSFNVPGAELAFAHTPHTPHLLIECEPMGCLWRVCFVSSRVAVGKWEGKWETGRRRRRHPPLRHPSALPARAPARPPADRCVSERHLERRLLLLSKDGSHSAHLSLPASLPGHKPSPHIHHVTATNNM